jgi:phosphopantothenoylcysteine decarboxylase / phosphopantothenate---cysteine ligase
MTRARARVVLGVTGGIAAYKSAEIVRALVQAGASVQVMMTAAATRFISPLTLGVLSGKPVVADLWDPASGAVDHIDLARRTDVLAIAPATADALAKLANGIADDVLSTYALAHRGEVVVAPAMNTWMWAHEATVANLERLRSRGVTVVEPATGDLACGDVGPGRLAPPESIVPAVLAAAERSTGLSGRSLVVTAGPTREPIDPVRFLSNRSSGRMGFAIAREAARRGAQVTLVSGPVSLPTPPGVRLVKVEQAAQMRDAVLEAFPSAHALVMAAAPADFVAAAPSRRKLKRSAGLPEIALALAPDILAEVRKVRTPAHVVVAFAAETENLLANARRKLFDKGADLLVANDVSGPESPFESDMNEVAILAASAENGGPSGLLEEFVPRSTKTVVAGKILDRVVHILDQRCPESDRKPPANL